MCRAVKCKNCGKTTWAGCGNHVAEVKAKVPAGQWCTCGSDKARQEKPAKGLFARLFG